MTGDEQYIDHAMANLGSTSRTAGGVVDTTASAGNAGQLAEGLTGPRAADLASDNYRAVLEFLYQYRDLDFPSPEVFRGFIEKVVVRVNAGITRDGVDGERVGQAARIDLNAAIRDRIEGSPNKTRMLQIYEQILRRRPVPDEERSPAKNELKITGLVRPSPQGWLQVRNRIYQTVFDLAWVRRNLPRSRTRQIALLRPWKPVRVLLNGRSATYSGQYYLLREYHLALCTGPVPDQLEPPRFVDLQADLF